MKVIGFLREWTKKKNEKKKMNFWLFLFLTIGYAQQPPSALFKDVCIVGGGASGMYAAVWLHDHNYSTVVLESQEHVGGHCDTISNPIPPFHSSSSILDIGVLFWLDTQKLNSLNIGFWDIDTVEFVKRFTDNNSILSIDLSKDPRIPWKVDMTLGKRVGLRAPVFPPTHPSPEYIDAWNRYFYLVNTTYSWVGLYNYPFNYFPDPIPSELLLSFSDWIQIHNFTALLPLFHAFLNVGGYTPYEECRTLDMLLNLPPALLKAVEVPDIGFIILPGCQTMYDNITKWLENSGNPVLLKSVIESSSRPLLDLDEKKTIIIIIIMSFLKDSIIITLILGFHLSTNVDLLL